MKRKILIFSAGPAGREIFQLILSINKASGVTDALRHEWEIIGYVDDDTNKVGKTIDDSTANRPKKKEIYAACGVADVANRKKIFDEEIIKNNYKLTNLIHPLVEQPKCFKIGLGNIIFDNVHISFEVNVKNFSI